MHRSVYLFVFLVAAATGAQAIGGEPVTPSRLSLAEAIDIGMSHHPALRSAQEAVNAASGRFWSGIALPKPELSVTYEYVPLGQRLARAGEKTLSLSQSMDFPTVSIARGAKLWKERSAAESESERVRMSVASAVKSAYYAVLFHQAQVRIAEENLAIMEDFSKTAGIRQRLGEGTNLESLTARVQRAEALSSRDAQRNRLSAARAELNEALGVGHDDGRVFVLTDTLGFARFDLQLERLVSDALAVNATLKTQALRVDIAGVDETLAWSDLLPKIDLAYYRQTIDGDNGFYGASVGVSVPVWFMFDQKGKIQEAAANRSIAESDLHQARNRIALGVQQAFAEFRSEEAHVLLYQKEILPEAEEIYRSAARSYEAGEISYLEFLQARQTIISSKSSYVGALFAYNRAIVALEDAIGYRLPSYQ